MKSRKLIVMCVAGFAVACPLALAGPGDKATGKPTNRNAIHHTLPNPFANPEQTNFTDNFDSYAVGAGIVGRGGWEFWTGTFGDVLVTTAQAHTPANSVSMELGADVVQPFAITSGMWEFTAQTYVPSTAPEGDGMYIILMNQYGAVNNWSIQIAFNETFIPGAQFEPYKIESQWDGAVLPLILDQWVEFKAVIDLDNDVVNTFYGGTPLGVNLMWTQNNFAGGPGILQIAVLDLYTSSSLFHPASFIDSVSLIEMGTCPCACSFDPDPACDIFDFLAFQNLFVGGEPCACDMDPDPACDIFDFLAFQNEFVLGCP